MKKITFLIIAILYSLLYCNVQAQMRIDSSFAFLTDPAKKYSIYLPSDYSDTIPSKMMLALHPLNVTRWNAESWCDTLIAFADSNNLILLCPDGGADGKIDDPIDTAFTTALLDSAENWYNIDHEKIFVMGFSWGGKTTYTYGLRRPNRFAGYMPIGAAVSVSEIAEIDTNANGNRFYVVHGGSDSPNIRFTPLTFALEANHACLESLLMAGVGHTIDFPNRNQILTEAFQYLDSVSCSYVLDTINTTDGILADFRTDKRLMLYPSILKANEVLTIEVTQFNDQNGIPKALQIVNNQGRVVQSSTMLIPNNGLVKLKLNSLPSGIYYLRLSGYQKSFIVR